MGIMVITTAGLPPFAAFFSKGLILTSVTEANMIQGILLYVAAAITFSYCIRMFSLVFMGKESEHIKKQHVHEAPKVMLVPAAILTALCCLWGVSMTGILDFMSKSALTAGLTSLHISLLGAFEVPELIFLALLVPTFLLVYWSYNKGFMGARKIGGGKNPIATMLNHGYFVDDLYYAFAKGLGKVSAGLERVEGAITVGINALAASPLKGAARLRKPNSRPSRTTLPQPFLGLW
jgi:NADH:ubiquinone oxidoreductase subunit 5 (subunit L)/multisubunit Na+/H+ antiporter MnhA subunit